MKITFIEHEVTAMIPEEGKSSGDKGFYGFVGSEEDMIYKGKLTWMRDTRIRLFIKMELLECRDELDLLMRCHACAFNNYPEEYWILTPERADG